MEGGRVGADRGGEGRVLTPVHLVGAGVLKAAFTRRVVLCVPTDNGLKTHRTVGRSAIVMGESVRGR
jgi:hypothetical protein